MWLTVPCVWATAFTLAVTPPSSSRGSIAPAETDADEQLLRDALIATDGPSLLAFLRQRTLSGADQERLAAWIRQLGDQTFQVREQASTRLIAVGPSALPVLRGAMADPDPEVRRRARLGIESIQRSATLPAAVVRLIRAHPPDSATEVLLGYLPFADDESVSEEILGALVGLGLRDGQAEPVLTQALRDRVPPRRAAAALVLGRFGNAEQKSAARRLLTDADAVVRLRAAQGLIAARDASAVPTLLDLLQDAPIDVALQAENLLEHLADQQAPTVFLSEDIAVRRKCHAAWKTWWEAKTGKLDLARADVDLAYFHPSKRAREVTQQMLTALFKGNSAVFRKTTDVPFYLAGETYPTRKELDVLFKEIQDSKNKMTFAVSHSVRWDDYLKSVDPQERNVLAPLPRPHMHAVYVQIKQDKGSAEYGILYVRVIGSRSHVIGYGEGKPPEKK